MTALQSPHAAPRVIVFSLLWLLLGSWVQAAEIQITASRAETARLAERYDEAEELYRQALEEDPERVELLRPLAEVLFASGKIEQALIESQRSVELAPDDPLNHSKLAELLAAVGRPDAAAVAYGQALELEQGDPTIWLGQARVLAMLQRHPEAIEGYDKALALRPAEASILALRARSLARSGRFAGAERDLRSALSLEKENRAIQLDLAELLIRMGKNAASEEQLRSVLEDAGISPQTRHRATFALASLRHGAGRLPEAIELYREILEAEPKRGNVRFRLGLALAASGEIDQAEVELRQAVEIRGRDAETRLAWVQALEVQKNFSGAIQALESGLLNSRDPRLPNELARLLAVCPEESLRDPERAVELARRAMEAEPSLEFASTLALSLAEAGRLEEAVALQKKIVEDSGKLGVDEENIDGFRGVLAAYEARLENREEKP